MSPVRLYNLLLGLAVGVILVALGACSAPQPAECTAGAKGCPCKADKSCGDGLACDRGYCVPGQSCPAGTDGCACLEGSSCSGGQLACVAGKCVNPACTAGTSGCPCGAADYCQAAGDACVSGLCVKSTCVFGDLGCPCNAGACSGDLVCSNRLCRAHNTLSAGVTAKTVRACELVLVDGARPVAAVRFPTGVVGESVHEGKRTAVALTLAGDTAPPDALFEVELSGQTKAAPADVTVDSVHCFDRTGADVAQHGLALR